MLIHLSKFEFDSKGKQIIAAQNIENKNSTQGKKQMEAQLNLERIQELRYKVPIKHGNILFHAW